MENTSMLMGARHPIHLKKKTVIQKKNGISSSMNQGTNRGINCYLHILGVPWSASIRKVKLLPGSSNEYKRKIAFVLRCETVCTVMCLAVHTRQCLDKYHEALWGILCWNHILINKLLRRYVWFGVLYDLEVKESSVCSYTDSSWRYCNSPRLFNIWIFFCWRE
jgi:hypothetical protein